MDRESINQELDLATDACEQEDNLLQLVIELLTDTKLMDKDSLPQALQESTLFTELYGIISDMRGLSNALSKGDLRKFVYNKGYIISNLKALQSNLRHLTWQTQKLAEGDFSQRVDFLGEFSVSFNIMAQKLEDNSLQLKKLASIDTLTQVANRRKLDEFLLAAFDHAKNTGTRLSVLMFDIDHFKRVNDTYGHSVGDIVLAKVSHTLSKIFRSSDMFARFGGEEFMAVLPGCSIKKAAEIAQNAIKTVAEREIAISDSTSVSITVSAGVSELEAADTAYHEIINRSDAALYQAKRTGRNRVCLG